MDFADYPCSLHVFDDCIGDPKFDRIPEGKSCLSWVLSLCKSCLFGEIQVWRPKLGILFCCGDVSLCSSGWGYVTEQGACHRAVLLLPTEGDSKPCSWGGGKPGYLLYPTLPFCPHSCLGRELWISGELITKVYGHRPALGCVVRKLTSTSLWD